MSLGAGWRPFLLPFVFVVVTLPLALLLAVITPLGAPADETAHAGRAESLAEGQWIAHRGRTTLMSGAEVTSAGVEADTGILFASEALYTFRTIRVTAADEARARQIPWSNHRTYVEITPIAVYFPVLYAPAALAIFGAKLAGATPFAAFFAARFMNVAGFAALGLAALLVARRGQGLLFCVLSVPMTVSLAGSVSPDGLLISSSTLVVALMTRASEPTDGTAGEILTPGRSRAIGAAVVAVISLAKFPYAVLAGLLVLPVQSLDRALLRRVGVALVAALPATVWITYAMLHIAVPWPIKPTYGPGPLWPGPPDVTFTSPVPASQLRVLLADPLRVVTLTWNTMIHDQWISKSAVGVLGHLNIVLPGNLYSLWEAGGICALIAAALCGGAAWRVHWRWGDALIAAVVICLGVIAVYMSQYLTWTLVGAATVEGPTGRYLLPLVPALALAIPSIRGPWLGAAREVLLVPAYVAALVGLAEVPRLIVENCWLN